MANIKSSKKYIAKSQKRRKYNVSRRSMMRTFVKKVYTAISSCNKETAQSAFSLMQSVVDSNSRYGIIHKNKASRYKSNLMKYINKMVIS